MDCQNLLPVQRHGISSTSALALLWTDGKIHRGASARKYLEKLRLNSGKELLSKCNRVWPHYGEVIKNRKSCILELAGEIVRGGVGQIVTLGAGMDPLSLEVCEMSQKARVFEVDFENMGVKSGMIKKISPSLGRRICCITADISRPNTVMRKLVEDGWAKNRRTLVILEGISYYLAEERLWDMIRKFSTLDQRNRVILEYLLPSSDVQKNRAGIPNRIFHIIARDFDLAGIVRYSISDIRARVRRMGGEVTGHHTMREMEKNRTCENRYFKTKKSGWIEICRLSV